MWIWQVGFTRGKNPRLSECSAGYDTRTYHFVFTITGGWCVLRHFSSNRFNIWILDLPSCGWVRSFVWGRCGVLVGWAGSDSAVPTGPNSTTFNFWEVHVSCIHIPFEDFSARERMERSNKPCEAFSKRPINWSSWFEFERKKSYTYQYTDIWIILAVQKKCRWRSHFLVKHNLYYTKFCIYK